MSASPASPYVRWSIGLLLLATAFRLFYSTHLELVGDEAYYWLWSRHPDYCYLDKGPMIAWFITAGTALFGQTVYGIRFFAVLLSGGATLGMWLLARRMFSERVAFWTVVLGVLVPLFAVGSLLMTIDTIYVFFWAWAALNFWQAKDGPRLGPWLFTGLLVGLGILSKYTAAMELVTFLVFCAWHGPAREQLRRPGFYLMVLTALLFFGPMLLWNIQHDWPTTRWLVHRGALDEHARIRPQAALNFLGGQAGVISPLLFLGLLLAAFRPSLSCFGKWGRAETSYALALFLPLFGLYVVLSFQQSGQANWTAAAYVGGMLLLAALWDAPAHSRTWARNLAFVALAVAALETVAVHESRWLHLPPGKDPLDRARGSRSLAAAVAQAQEQNGLSFVIADKYMTAALLSFYLPGQPETFMPVSSAPFNQLIMWPTYAQRHPTGDALLVSSRAKLGRSVVKEFRSVTLLSIVQTSEAGRQIGTFYLFHCHRALVPTALTTPKTGVFSL